MRERISTIALSTMPLRAALVAAFCLAALVRGEEQCTDCHLGQNKAAPQAITTQASAHAGVECAECHVDVKLPCKKNMPRPTCEQCHEDEGKALYAATHGALLKKCLEKEIRVHPTAACMSCHGADVHNIRPARDPAAPASRHSISATCLGCHEKQPRNQNVAFREYLESVHGQALAKGILKTATCADCHGTHAIDGSLQRASKVHRTTVSQTCGLCHPEEREQYETSAHWTGARKGFHEPPVCTDCHGEHGIHGARSSAAPTAAGNLTKTCAACHASEKLNAKFNLPADRVTSFKESFHGLAGALGDLRVANCASCHSHHAILPVSDPRSTVNPANLNKTCGACHPGADVQFAGVRVHTSTARPAHWSVWLARHLYIALIVLVIGAMAFHNLLDLYHKIRRGPAHERELGLAPRLTVNERVQHGLLVVSFVLLALSGFALKFPESPFAWPFKWCVAVEDVRRFVHRIGALLLVTLAAYHAFYLLTNPRGREQRQALRPRWQDVRDALTAMRRYLGRTDEELTLPHHSYAEKAEYWALVWGSVVMTVTGLVLLFVNVSLAHVPLWAVDLARVIHYMEALLAVLSLLVWHGYRVICDPEVFPMNLAWLIGQPRKSEKSGERSNGSSGEQQP